jgi:transcriptional regulator with XRE-family HTH domain
MKGTNKESTLQKLGLRIKLLREKLGLTQTELASRCDMERQNFNQIEKGKVNVTVNTLLIIATQLDVSLKTLFDFE